MYVCLQNVDSGNLKHLKKKNFTFQIMTIELNAICTNNKIVYIFFYIMSCKNDSVNEYVCHSEATTSKAGTCYHVEEGGRRF